MSTDTKPRKDWADRTAAIFIVGIVLVIGFAMLPGIRYSYYSMDTVPGMFRVDRLFGGIDICRQVPGDSNLGTSPTVKCF